MLNVPLVANPPSSPASGTFAPYCTQSSCMTLLPPLIANSILA